MREITLPRVWDKIEKEMMLPAEWEEDFIGYGNRKIGLYFYRSKKDYRQHFSLDWILRHPESFETLWALGCKDINGKDTYGGDIVKFPNHEYLAEIKYYPEFAAFLFDSHNDKTRNNPNAQMLWRDAFEIIGNIYEHPKLLEESEAE